MTVGKPRRRTKRRATGRRPQGAPATRRDLNAASRALLGKDEEARAVRPPREDASVEDPLQDWPED